MIPVDYDSTLHSSDDDIKHDKRIIQQITGTEEMCIRDSLYIAQNLTTGIFLLNSLMIGLFEVQTKIRDVYKRQFPLRAIDGKKNPLRFTIDGILNIGRMICKFKVFQLSG